MTRLIERNTTIPCNRSETFSTAVDGQAGVDIHVLQGERQFSNDNKTLGNFQMTGIAPAPRGVPQIEVSFDIDANGIVNVSAKNKATNEEQSIKIQDTGALTDEEIGQMVEDAEKNREADNKRKEEIDQKNHLDTMIYQVESLKRAQGEKLTDELLTSLSEAIDDGKSALESGDASMISASINNLQNISVEASVHLQQIMKEELVEELDNDEEDIAPSSNVVDADFNEASQ